MRSWWSRHEPARIAAAVAAALHHSAGPATYKAPRGTEHSHCQVEVHEQINVPRGLTQPPPGAVPPAGVVEGLLLVSVVMVQEVAHDDATMAFFLGHSLAEKQCEEEVELEVQLVTKEQRVVMLVEELLAGVQRLGPTSRGSRWVSLAGS